VAISQVNLIYFIYLCICLFIHSFICISCSFRLFVIVEEAVELSFHSCVMPYDYCYYLVYTGVYIQKKNVASVVSIYIYIYIYIFLYIFTY